MKKKTVIILTCLALALVVLVISRSAARPGANQVGEVCIGRP